MKKLVGFIFLLFFFVTACDKDDGSATPIEPPPPPPVEKKAEVTIKFGPLPEECIDFHPLAMGFKDSEGFFTDDLTDEHYKYPEFTYQFNKDHAEKYLGKKVTFYLMACRNLSPMDCWGMEWYVDIDTLKVAQEIFIEIPGQEVP